MHAHVVETPNRHKNQLKVLLRVKDGTNWGNQINKSKNDL